MRAPCLAFLLSLPLAVPAAAQDPAFDPAPTARCFDAGGGAGCFGLAADACIVGSPLGDTTPGRQFCLGAEERWWDARLNETYRRAMDAATADDGAILPGSGQPRAVDTLRAMQRAWIAFRDATCEHEIQSWYGGTGASEVWLACLGRMTAQQTAYLDGLAGGGWR